MTINEALKQGKQILKKSDIPQYALDAEVILAQVLRVSREYLFTHGERALTFSERDDFLKNINKREQWIPLAYIVGYKQFCGLDLYVDENVLVPRPETEVMVDEVLRLMNEKESENIALLDIGTGSGCLVVTLASYLGNIATQYFAFDNSRKALRTAYKNAEEYNVEQCIKFVYGNLMEPVFENIKEYRIYNNFIITANLPYLTPEQYQKTPSIRKEPRNSLVGGEIGLEIYKDLLHQVKLFKLKTDACLRIFAEIDPTQASPFRRLARKEFGEYELNFKKDGAGHQRVAILNI